MISLTVLLLTFISCKKTNKEEHGVVHSPGVLPVFSIQTVDSSDILSKDYVKGRLVIDGKGLYNNYEGTLKVAGRGNTSWELPKKPYKIKLDKAEALFGLSSAKKWILLAEYLDGTMLYNSIPFEAARMLGMPYTNHIIPVELNINGIFRGVYALTESKEVEQGRIDIGEDGILLELDRYLDEPWHFISENYQLPVMVVYPEEEEMDVEKLNELKDDFEHLETLIYDDSFPNNNYLDYFDDLAFVNYMLVYQLCLNREINHPKSTYIHKKEHGKYSMGIIWDFDWSFGYNDFSQKHYEIMSATDALFEQNGQLPGTRFFSRIMEDPHIRQLFKIRWNEFKANHFNQLKDSVRKYAYLIETSRKKDHEKWGLRGSMGNTESDLRRVLAWLDARAAYIDTMYN